MAPNNDVFEWLADLQRCEWNRNALRRIRTVGADRCPLGMWLASATPAPRHVAEMLNWPAEFCWIVASWADNDYLSLCDPARSNITETLAAACGVRPLAKAERECRMVDCTPEVRG